MHRRLIYSFYNLSLTKICPYLQDNFTDRFRLSFLFTMVLLVSCRQNINQDKNISTFKIEVTDFRGKKIQFAKQPERIVCLIESALSGFYMLNAESRIVGVPSSVYNESTAAQYAILDERIKNKTLIAPGNWDFVSIESVVALQPDLVIIWASQKESIESLEEKGIPVYAVFLANIKDVEKEIKDLGALTGTAPRADSLIQYTKNEISKISAITKDIKDKKKIYFMWSQGPLETSGKESTVNELIELAGALNACPDKEEHLIVNTEKVLEWNPDLIVMWCNTALNPDNICTMQEWSNCSAIKKKQVYELPSVFFCDLWTLKYQYAVQILATWCYPERFMTGDIIEVKKKMLQTLYGEKGLKLNE